MGPQGHLNGVKKWTSRRVRDLLSYSSGPLTIPTGICDDKGTSKVVPVNVMKACRGTRGTPSLICNLSTG